MGGPPGALPGLEASPGPERGSRQRRSGPSESVHHEPRCTHRRRSQEASRSHRRRKRTGRGGQRPKQERSTGASSFWLRAERNPSVRKRWGIKLNPPSIRLSRLGWRIFFRIMAASFLIEPTVTAKGFKVDWLLKTQTRVVGQFFQLRQPVAPLSPLENAEPIVGRNTQ